MIEFLTFFPIFVIFAFYAVKFKMVFLPNFEAAPNNLNFIFLSPFFLSVLRVSAVNLHFN